MKGPLILAAFGMVATALPAALAAQTADPAKDRIRRIIVYGTDPCPPSTGDEVVVCARRPETERYRIPQNLREAPDSPESESWAERAEALETVGQTGIESCSPVGPGGATGCLQQLIDRARTEQRSNAQTQSKVP